MQKLISNLLLLLVFIMPVFAKESVTIGVVSDGVSPITKKVIGYIKKEVDILTKGEFIVNFPVEKQLNGSWGKEGIKKALDKLYKDKEVDIVIAIGFGTAAIAVNKDKYPKPTLVSTIIHTKITNAPLKGKVSGKHNLTYITIQADLKDELQQFKKITPFKNVVLISDALIAEVMPKIKNFGKEASQELGVNLTILPHKGESDLLSKLPKNTEAVLLGALPRMDNKQLKQLINTLTKKGIPTHSMVSANLVNLGALSSAMPSSNKDQYAKRFALGIQSVLLGENLKDLRVFINRDKQLNINIQTAKALNISPSFDLMLESQKINDITNKEFFSWDLQKVSKQALIENLNINSSKLNLKIGKEQISEKESKLYPQLVANINHQNRKDTGSSSVASQNGKASLTLNQILYDQSTWSNLDIEKLQQDVRVLTHKQTQLDILEDANIAFLNVLKAKTLKKMQEDNMNLSSKNLKLATIKVKIGSSTNSDIYRWESELANAQAEFLTANANLKEAQEFLNQLLNRPLNEKFSIDSHILDNPSSLISDSNLYTMLSDNKKYEYLSEAFSKYGLNSSPKIATYLKNITIQQRTLKTQKQKYYIPTLSLNGEYSNTYYDNADASFSNEGDDDWMVGLTLSLPLYEGGGRTHSVNRAKLTLNQLKIQLQNTKRTVEKKIRDNLRTVQVSKFSIKLKKRAAYAAQKNYELVYDAYSKGSMGIIELIDAQNSKIIAKLNAVNSRYQFFIDFIKLQRSIGNLDFFINDDKTNIENLIVQQHLGER